MIGPGKYDKIASAARKLSGAEGIVLIVIQGKMGNGLCVQATDEVTFKLPELLRLAADTIEKEIKPEFGQN